MRARNVEAVDCTFDCQPNDWCRGAADLYGVNENIRFEGCVFRQLTGGTAGGIWVRNWTDQAESRNIRFEDCDFYKSGADEVLAVWGWGGAVREVVLSGCGFYETETEESLAAGNRPVWFITLGQSGITDVRMERCTIWADRCEVIFHMVGDKTHAVVDNCDITLNQPDDVAGHDIRKSANPMLAQGNGRARRQYGHPEQLHCPERRRWAAHQLSAQRPEGQYAGSLPRARHRQHQRGQRQYHPGPDTA